MKRLLDCCMSVITSLCYVRTVSDCVSIETQWFRHNTNLFLNCRSLLKNCYCRCQHRPLMKDDKNHVSKKIFISCLCFKFLTFFDFGGGGGWLAGCW